MSAGRLMRALDEALPQFDVNEVHSISLACGPEEAVQRALAAPAAPDRLTAALFRARGLRRGTTIQELFDRTGFETIARSPTEVVFAASGTPWRPSGGLRPFAAAEAGNGARCNRHPRGCGRRRLRPLHRDARAGRRRRCAARLSPLLARRRPVLGPDPPAVAASGCACDVRRPRARRVVVRCDRHSRRCPSSSCSICLRCSPGRREGLPGACGSASMFRRRRLRGLRLRDDGNRCHGGRDRLARR